MPEPSAKSKEKQKIPFFSRLQVKYALSYLALLAVVLVLLNTYPLIASQNLLISSKEDSLRSQIAVMSSALMELETLSADQVARVMNMLDNMGLERILVTDPSGLILYDSLTQGQSEEGEDSSAQAPPSRPISTPCFRRWPWPSRGTTCSTPTMRTGYFSPPPPPPSCTGA